MTSSIDSAKVGVFGGSGLYSIASLKNSKEINIDTPYGKTSDSLISGTINGIEVVFLARHGRGHTLLPSEIPYRANIWAMRSLGVKWIISASAVGSLKEEIKPLDIVIPDQFIDRTHSRPITFFGDGAVAHVSMADPFCSNLSNLIADTAKFLLPKERKVHRGGTYLCMEGPAFSTRAESEFYRSLGCSIIGMTNHTEARLAREAELAYASIAMSTDYDCWHNDHENVTVEMIISNLQTNSEVASQIICKTIEKIGESKPFSKAHSALKDGLMTPKEKVPLSTRKRINLFTEKYWGSL